MAESKALLHTALSDREVRALVRSGDITMGGNRPLKIYGRLSCKSGKRMHRRNRIFFESEAQAQREGFRPCGHCMRPEYQMWKAGRQR